VPFGVRSSAFFRRYCEERFGFLLHVLAATVGASHAVVIVFVQAKNLLEFLATIIAEIVIHGHGEPPRLEKVP
jgi:hypothetical protein